MRRLRGHLLTLCSAASLLVCVASAVVWARSFNVRYVLTQDKFDAASGDERRMGIDVATGSVLFSYSRVNNRWTVDRRQAGWQLYRDAYWYAERRSLGFRVWNYDAKPLPGATASGPAGSWNIGFNLLFVIAMAAILPVVWRIQSLHRRRRDREGRCQNCGYDLRASPDRCPEMFSLL